MEPSSLSEQILFTTVRVETEDTNGQKGIGTSFIFNYNLDSKSYLFLVTNKHVVSDAEQGNLTFTVSHNNKPVLGQGFRYYFPIDFEKSWEGHPNEEIDVTVTPLVPILEKIQKAPAKVEMSPAQPFFFYFENSQLLEIAKV